MEGIEVRKELGAGRMSAESVEEDDCAFSR